MGLMFARAGVVTGEQFIRGPSTRRNHERSKHVCICQVPRDSHHNPYLIELNNNKPNDYDFKSIDR